MSYAIKFQMDRERSKSALFRNDQTSLFIFIAGITKFEMRKKIMSQIYDRIEKENDIIKL